MWGKTNNLILLVIGILIVLPSSLALTINPLNFQIDKPEFNKEYDVIITLINTETTAFDINANIAHESLYLKDYVTIDPFFVHLEPNEKKNIKLTLNIAQDISPQEHSLIIEFITLEQKLGKFRLDFEIEGEKIINMSLEGLDIIAEDTETPLYFMLTMSNNGNININPEPNIEIYKNGNQLDSFGQESKIMILPGKSSNLSLMYDPSKISEGGLYTAKAFLKVDDTKTEPIEKTFHLKKIDSQNKETEVITINRGQTTKIEEDIINPTTELAFYRIDYYIEGTKIEGREEGDLRDVKTNVKFKIDTSKVEEGEYSMTLKIYKGKKLEELEKKEITLVVESNNFIYNVIYGVIIATGIIGIILLFKFNIPQEAFDRIAGARGLSTKHIENEVSGLKQQISEREKDFQKLGNDIGKFMEKSNSWLDYNIGRQGTRFK